MRLIWLSDDITFTTGFGIQSKQVLYRLKAAHPEWNLATYHWAQPGIPFFNANGILMLPRPYGEDNYRANIKWYIEQFHPEYIVTLHDIFYSSFMTEFSHKSQYSRTRWINWFVYDMMPGSAPKHWKRDFELMDAPIAMSKYAQEDLKNYFSLDVERIPHGVDKKDWPDLSKDQIDSRRQTLGNPDFIMGAFFRNTFRKQPVTLLEAWSHIHKEYPHAKLLLRMQRRDWLGYDIAAYINHFNIQKSILISESINPTLGQNLDELNVLYQICDAQVLPTMGEGFGIPIIEGYAACGLPVIMTKCTTYDELVGDHGLPIAPINHIWSTEAGAQVLPDVKHLIEQMRVMIDDAGMRNKFQQVNREFWKQYDFDTVVIPKWIQLIEKLEKTPLEYSRFRCKKQGKQQRPN